MNRNYTIDAFRMLGAFAVVVLHTSLGNLPNLLIIETKLLCRWAVPFFFMVSGFFFAKNLLVKGDIQFSKTIKNLVTLFAVANLVYFLVVLLTEPETMQTYFSAHLFLYGFSGHLWFIGAMIFGYLVLNTLLLNNLHNHLFIISLVCYVVVLVLGGYSRLLNLEVDPLISRYVSSITFLSLGFVISRSDILHIKGSIKAGVFLVICGVILQFFEAVALYKFSGSSPHNQELLIGTFLFANGMMLIAVKYQSSKRTILSRYGYKYSLPIYLYHPLVILIIGTIGYKINFANATGMIWYSISPLLILAILLSVFIFLERKLPMSFKFLSGN